jgi:hypothetical protein
MTKLIDLLVTNIHDAAHEVWDEMHRGEEDRPLGYDCKLCGATMIPGFSYEHKPTCAVEIMARAIEAYGDAIDEASAQAADEAA